MSKATNPTDEAYLVAYEANELTNKAIVIASNPFQARRKLERELLIEETPDLDLNSFQVRGVLRDAVHEAQETGVFVL